jgi:hypothetical protein
MSNIDLLVAFIFCLENIASENLKCRTVCSVIQQKDSCSIYYDDETFFSSPFIFMIVCLDILPSEVHSNSPPSLPRPRRREFYCFSLCLSLKATGMYFHFRMNIWPQGLLREALISDVPGLNSQHDTYF